MKVINLVLFLLSLILAGQSLFACPTCYYFMQQTNARHDSPDDNNDPDIVYANGVENEVFDADDTGAEDEDE